MESANTCFKSKSMNQDFKDCVEIVLEIFTLKLPHLEVLKTHNESTLP
jgi:hypothetical protein